MFNKIWFKFPERVSLKTLVLRTPCFGSSYPQVVRVPPVKNHCPRVQHNKHICEITVVKNWWVVLLVSRFICLKGHDYPARLLRGWFHQQSPCEISRLWDWDRVALNHSVTNWETWFWLNCFCRVQVFRFSWSFGSTWGIYQESFDKTTFPASATAALKIASLSPFLTRVSWCLKP